LNEAMQIEICSVCGEILHATLRNFNVQVWQVILQQVGHIKHVHCKVWMSCLIN
jgi:hypothetical protein